MTHATTSAMEARSTKSVAEMPTISRRHSVVGTSWHLGVVTATMPAAVTNVHITHALSSVSAKRCTLNVASPLTIPPGAFAATSA